MRCLKVYQPNTKHAQCNAVLAIVSFIISIFFFIFLFFLYFLVYCISSVWRPKPAGQNHHSIPWSRPSSRLEDKHSKIVGSLLFSILANCWINLCSFCICSKNIFCHNNKTNEKRNSSCNVFNSSFQLIALTLLLV